MQGISGFSLLSSARICELYSGGPESSYICSIKGSEQRLSSPPADDGSRDQQENEQQQQQLQQHAEQVAESPPAKLWRIEHRLSTSFHAPASLTLRLLSLVQKDVLHLRSLHLLPAETAQQGSPDSTPAAGGSVQEQRDGGAAGGGAVAAASAAPAPPTAGLSQVESVRRMLGQLVAAEGSDGGGSGGAQQDPKRALLAAIARSVLQQAPRPPRRDGGGLELVPLVTACSPAAPGSSPDPADDEGQQQLDEPGCEGGRLWADGQLQQVLRAVERLEARVARVEEACVESNTLLRQLVSLLQQ
jgi:hypothetical protein